MDAKERQRKAALYESYLRDYDKKAAEVSSIKSKFDLSKDDEKRIEELNREMDLIQRKAAALGDYHG